MVKPTLKTLILVGSVLCLLTSPVRSQTPQPADAPEAANQTEAEFIRLHQDYLSRFTPLRVECSKAWWEANTVGSEAAFERFRKAQEALVELHSDREVFARLKLIRETGLVTTPVQRRALDSMYRAYLPSQAHPELRKKIVGLESELEKLFNTYRARVGDRELTENDIYDVLASSTDSNEVEMAWKAYMTVGREVAQKLKKVVQLRNQMARQLGFKNFYEMSLFQQEIDETELVKLFDELDTLTRGPFEAMKAKQDAERAARFGISVEQLRPWHYGDLFFQEAIGQEAVNLDEVYGQQDLRKLVITYYDSMGMDVASILGRSDLYEKPGKCQHAFAGDIDREGDVRILCNLKNNTRWMDTLLHELGHAVYDAGIRRDLPFDLRKPSHAMTTEGVALMMGSMAKNEAFLTQVVKLPPEEAGKYGEAAAAFLRTEKLIFSRWAQVMMRFERELYKRPGQNLPKLWWDLKKEYQLLNPPDEAGNPDFAAKLHIVTVPVYYHSYMMGDLFACQLQTHLARKIEGVQDPAKTCFYGNREVGRFLNEEVFGSGHLYAWPELTQRLTGEPLTAKYFVEQYISQPSASTGSAGDKKTEGTSGEAAVKSAS